MSTPVVPSVLSVADVVGTYHGVYTYGSYWSLPPPGGSSHFSDTVFLQVRPDTTAPLDSMIFYAGYETFRLSVDSSISNQHGGVTSHYGGFSLVNDTLRLEWHRNTFGEFSDGSHSDFAGVKL